MQRAHRLGLIVLALFFMGIYGRYLGGWAPSGGDTINQYLPYQQLVRDSIRQGAAPLWNSMTFCGRPLMADIQVGVLYPPNWLHWFLPLPLSFALLLAAHAAWMLAGCYLLGRRWGLHPAAAALGAVLFAGSPFFTLKMSQGVILFIYVGAWWPWLALATMRLAERPNVSRAIMLALALALSLLAGSPQVTFYGWIATLALGLALPGAGGAKAWAGRSALLAGAFVLALALTAIQTFQTYYFVGNSFERAVGADWKYITNGSLEPRLLWLLLNPGYLGIGASEQEFYWPYPPAFGEVCYYLPLWAALILAPIGGSLIFRRDTRPLHRRLALLAVAAMAAGLLLAPGKSSLIFEFFFKHVPGFDRFRVPARLMIFFDAGVATLAALAFDRILTAPSETQKKYRLAILGGLAAILALLWWSYAFRMPLWRAIGYQSAGGFAKGPQIDRIVSAHALAMAARISLFAAVAAAALLALLRRPAGGALAFLVPLAAAAELAWLAWPFQTPGDPFHSSQTVASYRQTFYPQTPLVKALQTELQRGGRVLWIDDVNSWAFDQNQPEVYPNRMVMNGLADARGYDPVNAQWLGRWMNLLSGNDPNTNPGGFMFVTRIARPAWLNAMGVAAVISYTDLSHVPGLVPVAKFDFPIAPELTPDMAQALPGIHFDASRRLVTTLTVWRNERFRGLAFAAPFDMRRVAGNSDGALKLATMLSADPNIAPENAIVPDLGFLLKDLEPNKTLNLAPAIDERFAVRRLEAGPNSYRFETNFPAPALLCFAMSRYEGWTAAIGEAPSNIATIDGTFMGVIVPAGRRVVAFDFHPQGLVEGMWVSIFALVLIVYVCVRQKIVNRKH